MKKRIWSYLRVFIFLALGVALLWWITKDQDTDKIFREFGKANYFWIVLAGIIAIFSHYARALRWRLLIRSLGQDPGKSKIFRAVMSGYLANMVVPRLGEVSKCAVLSKSSNIPFNSLAGTMIAERLVDLITLFVLFLLTFLLQFNFLKDFLYDNFFQPFVENQPRAKLMLGLVAVVAITMLVFLGRWALKKIRLAKPGSFLFKIKIQIEGIAVGFKTLWRMKNKGSFLAYTFTIWFLYFLVAYVVFFAFDATSHLTVSAGITLLAIGSLGFLAPVPGGIGTYHFATILTLTQLYSIEQEPATSYAYLSHAMQMFSIVVTSAIIWFLIIVGKKGDSQKQNNTIEKQD